MATLLEMKTRIRLETNKDDIASGGESEAALTTAITQAIDHYANELFWFNRASGSVNTSASTATVALPSGMRLPLRVSYSQTLLRKVDLDLIEHLTDTGTPSYWAEDEGAIHLCPVPSGILALSVFGVAEIGVPGADGSSNVWTTHGYDLITARAEFLLWRDLWRNLDGVKLAAQAEGEALDRLRTETRRRTRTNLRHSSDAPWRTNYTDINLGA